MGWTELCIDVLFNAKEKMPEHVCDATYGEAAYPEHGEFSNVKCVCAQASKNPPVISKLQAPIIIQSKEMPPMRGLVEER